MSDLTVAVEIPGTGSVKFRIDIAPSSIGKKQQVENAVAAAMSKGAVSHFITPPTDPAYHLEIPQA